MAGRAPSGAAESLPLTPVPALEAAAPGFEAGPAVEPTAGDAGNRTGLLTVCVVPWEPIAMCDPTATSYAAANFTGHDVQLVRSAASKLGLQEGRDFVFRCDSFSTMIDSLSDPRGPCSAAASAITITSEREAAGVRFSYPYYKSSLSTLVQASHSTSDGWGFTRPFSWELWLALLGTLLIFPPLIFTIEFLSLRRRIHRGDVVPGVLESGWRSAITLMLMDGFAVTSQGARIAVLCFCFLALLVTSTYTANLAAFVTVNTIKSHITSIADLRGRAVGTSPIYVSRLEKYGIQAVGYPLQNGTDYLAWRDLVTSGQLAALVRDTPALQWLANTAPLCNVALLPEQIEPFDYGIAFHVNTSEAVVDAWSTAILKLQEDGTLEQLKENWIMDPNSGCLAISQVNKNAQAVSFSDLYGLWIILAAGLALGGSIMLAQRCLRRRRKHRGMGRHTGLAPGGDSPLPVEYQPLRFMHSVLSFGRRGRLSGSQRAQKQRGSGAAGSAPGAAAARPAAAKGAEAAVEPPSPGGKGWDLESNLSSELPAKSPRLAPPAATCGSPAGTPQAEPPRRVSASRATPASPASQAGDSSNSGQQHEERVSALQAADTIYGAIHWKSKLRASGASPAWRLGG
ncbi:hypothetical protein ABPG77_010243 [Micractinium sp. CCAP 211/92]